MPRVVNSQLKHCREQGTAQTRSRRPITGQGTLGKSTINNAKIAGVDLADGWNAQKDAQGQDEMHASATRTPASHLAHRRKGRGGQRHKLKRERQKRNLKQKTTNAKTSVMRLHDTDLPGQGNTKSRTRHKQNSKEVAAAQRTRCGVKQGSATHERHSGGRNHPKSHGEKGHAAID